MWKNSPVGDPRSSTKKDEAKTTCASYKHPKKAPMKSHGFLGGGFKYFLFSPLFGEMIQFDEHIFQMGGSTTNQ